jgi:anti-anti-sigma factor
MKASISANSLPHPDRDHPRRLPDRRRPASGPARYLSFGPDQTRQTTIVLSGDLDVNVAAALSRYLDRVLDQEPRRLVFDMSRVGFIDCATARLIAGTGRRLPGGTRPVIRRPGPVVRRVLHLTGLAADCELAS